MKRSNFVVAWYWQELSLSVGRGWNVKLLEGKRWERVSAKNNFYLASLPAGGRGWPRFVGLDQWTNGVPALQRGHAHPLSLWWILKLPLLPDPEVEAGGG